MKICCKITWIMVVISVSSLTNSFVIPKSKIVATKQQAFSDTIFTAPILTVNDFLVNGDPNYADEDAAGEFAPDECDYEADEYFDGRIIGGNAVSIRKFPFQASVQYNKVHICGGAIIAPNIIITAAHCLEQSQNINLYRIRVGSSQHKHGGQLVDVRSIISHELYSPLTLDNDVAIVVLAARLFFNQNVKLINVAKQSDAAPAKRRLFISGWGITNEMGSVSPVLRYTTVCLLNEHTCTESYRAFTRITPRMFCAGFSSGGRDSCQGDSGGPLVTFVGGKSKLLGVVSWGIGCAQKGYPGVYAKVSALRPWINARILELRQTNILSDKMIRT